MVKIVRLSKVLFTAEWWNEQKTKETWREYTLFPNVLTDVATKPKTVRMSFTIRLVISRYII